LNTTNKKYIGSLVTEMRLSYVLDKFPDYSIEDIGNVIKAMIKDIEIEAKDEIVMNKIVRKEISKLTALMFKRRLYNKLIDESA